MLHIVIFQRFEKQNVCLYFQIVSWLGVIDYDWRSGLGSESPHAHLSPCVLFHYNKMLNIVVRGDSKPIPKIMLDFFIGLGKCIIYY